MRKMPFVITCRELDDFLVDYLDGVLPAAQRRKIEMHLRLCPKCRRYLDEYRRALELSRQTFSELEKPGEMPQELVQAILNAREERD